MFRQSFDEYAEIGTKVLESLRTPLEDGEVRIARRDGMAIYPARFQLILAANPCPCAPPREADCVCAPAVRRRYLGKLSGPLVDRVDVRIKMRPIGSGGFHADEPECSADVRARVAAARCAAAQRWREFGFRTNGDVTGPLLRREFRLPYKTVAPLDDAIRRGQLTARGADRALRVAWTVADLRGAEAPDAGDVGRALGFRDEIRR